RQFVGVVVYGLGRLLLDLLCLDAYLVLGCGPEAHHERRDTGHHDQQTLGNPGPSKRPVEPPESHGGLVRGGVLPAVGLRARRHGRRNGRHGEPPACSSTAVLAPLTRTSTRR